MKKIRYQGGVVQETTIFVYDASGKMVAEYSTEVATVETAKVSYLTTDHLGSPRINTDRNGATVSRHDYQPFGEEITSRTAYGADAVRKKFTSYERDTESELDFAQARMYASKLGRFLSIDPSTKSVIKKDPQSWNRYSYCYNRPLILVDTNGKWPTRTHDRLIEKAFKGLSADNIAAIKIGSKKTDYFSGGKPLATLWPSEAHKHAMGNEELTPEKSKQKAQAFLKEKLAEVKKIQSEWEVNGGKGISQQALWVLGQATHVYEDATSPAHGFDKTYKIPTKTLTVTLPDGAVDANVSDLKTLHQELNEHAQEESHEPSSEEYATSALYSRAFFLMAFGEEKFNQLEMSEEDRKSVRALVDKTRSQAR